jgi:cytochrome c oxidase assembly factor CtaG
MIQHMVLNMVAPILLALGAPLTLALRSTPTPVRSGLLRIMHSSTVRFLTSPVLVATIFTASLFLLYFTPLFPVAMSTSVGHFLMQGHFLLSGYLFFWLLLGVDPGPRRPVEIARVPIIIVMVLAHTAFAFAVVFSQTILGESYFRTVSQQGAGALAADQALAGGIAWGIGEMSSAVVIVILLMQWFARAERSERAFRRARARRSGSIA